MADRKELLFTMLAAIALGAAIVAFALEISYSPSALFAPLRQGLAVPTRPSFGIAAKRIAKMPKINVELFTSFLPLRG